ncbi:MAG: hypothetical protein ACI84C_001270 [Flavobacteriales bacterium]|jgi:hypothetical protein
MKQHLDDAAEYASNTSCDLNAALLDDRGYLVTLCDFSW